MSKLIYLYRIVTHLYLITTYASVDLNEYLFSTEDNGQSNFTKLNLNINSVDWSFD